jgi:hypothetical protein
MWFSRRAPLAAAVTLLLLAGCGAGSSPSPAGQPTAGPARTQQPRSTPSASAPAPDRSGPPSALAVAPGAGALPQTRAFPSTHSAAFRNAMTDLWLAVITGNPRLGLPAFFPVAAYKQVKAIADPAADWRARLWYDFVLDVGAAHRLVTGGAR